MLFQVQDSQKWMNPAEDPKNLPPENLLPGLFYQMDGFVSDQ